MVDKRVYVKNIRSWFTDWNWEQNPHGAPIKITDRSNLKSSYVKYFDEVKPIDEHNPVYLFTSQAWFFGINLHSNKVSLKITKDKSSSVVSIMPTTTVPTRKIVDRIKISCDKNIVAKNADMLEFTILRVKPSIYRAEATLNYKTNALRNWGGEWGKPNLSPPIIGFQNETNDLDTHENIHICSNDIQLVNRGSFFSSSEVVLENVDYDLGLDDLVLLQKISFDKSIEAGTADKDNSTDSSDSMYFGISRKEYADYRVEVDYSYGYI